MQVFEEARAGRPALPRLVGAAASAEPEVAAPRPAAIVLAAGAMDLMRWLAARLAERRRRRARPRLGSWMAIDPRVLADIGVARADVQAVVYGGVPFAQMAPRGPAEAGTGDLMAPPRRWRPNLCLVATRELDAAA